MTALNFIFGENFIIISMDTLASNLDRSPFKFASKIHTLPHLRSVICGTGNLDLIHEWYLFVQRSVLSRDITYFSNAATKQLNKLNEKYPIEMTTTIYQFGYSEESDSFKGFVYRSTSEFEQEEFPYCYAMKPPTDYKLQQEYENGNLYDTFINLMIKQKLEDDEKETEWVGIGGDIHLLLMNKDTYKLEIIHRFSDYNELFDKSLENLNKRL